ncbi:MAG: iron-containing alcohol dehydrogenase, partial [Candidatus Bathyarchaeota archaeon]|nr:iron-containing alcohol dehydrogenase [Candidatus Bathyarchaeota archaeon]
MKTHTFRLPKKTLFGINAVERVGSEAREFGSRALVVTDSNIQKAGLFDRVREKLEDEEIEVNTFDEGGAEPTLEIARSAADAARKGKYDLVVGLGGGSVMDMAKVASITVT